MSTTNNSYEVYSCVHSRPIVALRQTKLFHFALLLSLVFLCLAAPISTFAQQASSTIRGVVKDPQGAVVPNATVTLINVQRNDQRQATTSEEGVYVFTSVDPTVYTIRVEATNFKTYELKEFTLSPSETRTADVALEIGPKDVTVSVVQEVSPIKADTGERSETITSKQIENLSIIGRSSLELLRILPGVVNNVDQNQSEFHSFGGGTNANDQYTVNGVRGTNNQVSIDGSRLLDIGSNNGTIITANNDMVQEVTVKTSNFAAEYGTSGVQIIATTKGGGSEYHGQLYYYARPNALAAADRQRTIIRQTRTPGAGFQYPGGQIGGPVPLPFTDFNKGRDRLFFFVGFEVQRQKANLYGTRFGIVPTQAERNGDFSSSLNTRDTFGRFGGQPVICNPNTLSDSLSNCTPVPNGNLQAAGLADPVGVALLNLYPLPNFTPSDPTSRRNYVSTVISPQNRTDLKMRFDLKVSEKTNAYLRLAREAERTENPYGLWWGASTIDLPTPVVGNNLGRSAALNVTTVLNPTMTNEFVFSASKLKLPNEYADPEKISRQALGLQNFLTPFQNPAFNLGNFRSTTPVAPIQVISWGDNSERSLRAAPGGLPIFSQNDSYSVSDTVSKVYKDHTLKFGGFVEVANKVQNNSAFSGNDGQIVVNSFNEQRRTTGANAFSNLYAGRINEFSQGTDVPIGHYRFWDVQFFAQDSWKIRPNFTLEYGVRVGFFPNNKEITGLGVVFDPSTYVRNGGQFIGGDLTRPNGYLLEARGDIPAGIFSDYPTKIMPRLNFAWDIFGDTSTVIRGGAGIFHNRVQGNFQQGDNTSPPNVLGTFLGAGSVEDNDLTLSDIPSRCVRPPCNVGSFNPLTNVSASTAVNSQNRNSNDIPQTISTSLSVARRIMFDNVLEVGYVGTFGRHLGQTRNVNFIPNGTVSGTLGNINLADPLQRYTLIQNAGNNGNAFRQLLPFPDYSGGVTFNEYTGTSNYHSLQVTLNRQLGRNLQYFLTYTFSKALGTTSTEGGSASLSSVDIRGRNYGILPFDRTHIFNASYNYNIPSIARGGFENWFTRGLFNGWQMSGITTFDSGRPLRLRLSGSISNAETAFAFFGTNENLTSAGLTGAIAPILLRNPQTGNTDVNSRYLDLSAIQVPGFGQTGAYQSPFYIRSPWRNNWDITLFKNFKINESKSIQFRVAAFNVFNQAFSNTDNGDIDLTLQTQFRGGPDNCARIPVGTPAGGNTFITDPNPLRRPCDPRAGFEFTQSTIDRFGRVTSKRGHRRMEVAVKFYF